MDGYAGRMAGAERGTWRDWLLYPALVLGVLTWPLWGALDLARDMLFQLRFRGAKDIQSFDGVYIVGDGGEVALADVVRARAWSYTELSMASGAEESMGLELRLRDGTIRRYAGYGLDRAFRALVVARKVRAEPENGGSSGGIGRVFMVSCWMLILAGAALVAVERFGAG